MMKNGSTEVARSQECSDMQGRIGMAERVGFEPTVRFTVRSVWRRVLSTAQSPLRGRRRLNRSRALRFSANGHSDHVTMKTVRTCSRLPINLFREWKDAGVNGVPRRKIG